LLYVQITGSWFKFEFEMYLNSLFAFK